ncbi:MAG: response regulator [Clostridia bacterium]|nr:response regulator [Clostridia bacterium]
MIKVVIAENNTEMYKRMTECIDRTRFGIELAASFLNGRDALGFLKNNDADILVTDIKMPLMDGFELISNAKKFKPDLGIIVLSGIDNFKTVKKAFKLGVDDYVLKKEFNPGSFLQLIKEVYDQKQNVAGTDKLSVNMKEYTLRQFFWSDTQLRNKKKEHHLAPEAVYRVAILKLSNYETVVRAGWSMEKELMKFGLSNCIAETLDNYGFGDFFFNTYDEVVFLFKEKENSCAEIRKIFSDIFSFLSQRFGIIATGVLFDTKDLPDHKEQYYILNRMLAYSFIFGNGILLSVDKINGYKDEPELSGVSERIEVDLLNMDLASFGAEIKNIETIKPAYEYIFGIKDIYVRVIKKLIKILRNYEMPASLVNLGEINMECTSVSELNKIIFEECSALSKSIEYSDVAIVQVQNYIKEHYSSAINLQFLAKEFLFSYTDLSRRFKKAAGMSFSEFLNDVRLTEAMKLIKTTDYMCSKIAFVVGYKNYECFSRAFKNKYGKAPNEVRKENKL